MMHRRHGRIDRARSMFSLRVLEGFEPSVARDRFGFYAKAGHKPRHKQG